jgi:hypothetical protein
MMMPPPRVGRSRAERKNNPDEKYAAHIVATPEAPT